MCEAQESVLGDNVPIEIQAKGWLVLGVYFIPFYRFYVKRPV